MDQFYIDLGIGVVITLLRSIKSDKKKATFKKVFLKVNNLIAGVYGDDKDFQRAWGVGEADE